MHRWEGALNRNLYAVVWSPRRQKYVRIFPAGDRWRIEEIR